MRRILLITSIVLAILVAAIAGGIVYVRRVLVPVTLKTALIERLTTALGRPVRLDRIDYAWTTGLTIEQLHIAQAPEDASPLIVIPTLTCRPLLIPLIITKKIIIPSLTLSGPEVSLIKKEDGRWGIETIMQSKGGTPSAIAIGKILIHDGTLSVKDRSGAIQDVSLNAVTAEISLSSLTSARFSLTGTYNNNPSSTIALSGSCHITKRILNLTTARVANIDLAPSIIPFLNLSSMVKAASITAADTSFSIDKQKITMTGSLSGALHLTIPGLTLIHQELSLTDIDGHYEPQAWDIAAAAVTSRGWTIHHPSVNIDGTAINLHQISLVKKGSGYTLNLPTASAEGLTVHLKDQTLTAHFVRSQNARLNMNSGDLKLTGGFECKNISLPLNRGSVSGNIAVPALDLTRDQDVLTVKTNGEATGISTDIPGKITLTGDYSVDAVTLQHKKGQTIIDLAVRSQMVAAKLPDGITLNGPVQTSGKLTLTPKADPAYQGSITLTNVRLSGLKKIPDVGSISGILTLETDRVVTKKPITLSLGGQQVHLTAMVKNFNNPYCEATISASGIRLEDYSDYAGDFLTRHRLAVRGSADVDLEVQGPLSAITAADYTITAHVTNAAVSLGDHADLFQEIRGEVKYKKGFVSWSDLKFSSLGTAYSSTGTLKNFDRPVISFKLNNPKFQLSLSSRSSGNQHEISRLELKGGKTSLSGQGRISTSTKIPMIELSLEGQIDTATVGDIDQRLAKPLQPFAPQGLLSMSLAINGPAQWPLDPKTSGSLFAQSRELIINQYALSSFQLSAGLSAGQPASLDLSALFYDGRLELKSRVQLDDPQLNMQTQFQLDGCDLAKLKNASPLKEKNLSGTLSTSFFMQGPLKETRSVIGNGTITATNGHLYTAILKGAWKDLLIDEFQNIVFTDGRATFKIKNNQIMSNDLYLRSQRIDLDGSGWIGLDKRINITFIPTFKESAILRTDSEVLKKVVTTVVTQTRGYITIKLTGTLDKPQHAVEKDPSKLMQKATEKLLDGMHNIFEGLTE